MEIIGVVTAWDLFQIEVKAGLYLVNLMVGFIWEELQQNKGELYPFCILSMLILSFN